MVAPPLDIATASRIVRWTVAICLALGALFLLVMGLLVRYTTYMRAKPIAFLLELFMISVIASLPIYFVAWARSSSYARATRDFVITVLYGAALWLFVELAGVNSELFTTLKGRVAFFDLSQG